jgi:hypothetical protein
MERGPTHQGLNLTQELHHHIRAVADGQNDLSHPHLRHASPGSRQAGRRERKGTRGVGNPHKNRNWRAGELPHKTHKHTQTHTREEPHAKHSMDLLVCTHGVRGVGCAWWCVVDDGTTGTLAPETWPRKTLRSPSGSGHHAQSVLPCEQFAHAHPSPACACGQCRATWCVQTAFGEPPGSAGAHHTQTSSKGQQLQWVWQPTPHTHTFTSASIWCSRMGLLQNSTKGLGLVKVKGRSRVPKPPTRIRAFSVCHE